jgi:SSS family solute:Na+ symporter
VTDVNQVFPHFILTTLPSGAKGILVAAILAAAMSSQSSALTALANTTVIDFLRRPPGEVRGFLSARRWVLIWGGFGTLAAFLCAFGDASILKKALFFTSLFTGPLLGLFLLAFFRPHLHPTAVLASACGGMAILLLFLKIPILPEGVWKPLYPVSWPWNPLISMTATLVLAHVLSAFFPRRVGHSPA